MDSINSKQDILSIKCIVKQLNVPSWGKDVFVKPMSKKDKLIVQKLIESKDEFGNEKMVCLCLCDADGKRILNDADYELVADLPEIGTQQIVNAIIELNTPADEESKKDSAS